MVAALLAFAGAWCWRGARWRSRALLACAGVAWIAGIAAAVLFHWQAVPGLAMATVLLIGLSIRWRKSAVPPVRSAATYWVGALLFIAAMGCILPYFRYPLVQLPPPDGAYAVGVRDFDIVRPAPLGAAAPSASRQLIVRVWYPAAVTQGFARRRYFTRQEALYQLPHYEYLHLHDVLTHSHVGAPLRTQDAPLPVVVFNHGYMSHIAQNTALMEQLASHGYVVFSLSHPHDGVTYRTGVGVTVQSHAWAPSKALEAALPKFMGEPTYAQRYAGYEAFRRAISQDRLAQSVVDWRDDDVFLVDQIAYGTPPAAISDIAPHLDTGKLAYAGMSFGGGTAATACQADVRCKAVVSLDGVNWDLSLFNTDLRAPMLFLQSDWLTHPLFPYQPKDPGTNPQDLAYEQWAHAGERSDIYRYRVADIAHLGMMDLVLIAQSPARDRRYGLIDARRAIDTMNAFTLSFLDTYLRGHNNGFPATVEAKHPQVQRHRADGVRTWWRSM